MISVGIDVSKGKSTVCIAKPGGELLEAPFDLLHTKPDLLRLAEQIKNYPEETKVVLEATGHYHWPVANFLTAQGISVSSVNALRMKKFCAQTLHRAKTDRIDSMKIAQYRILYWAELEPMKSPTEVYRELRTYSRQYYRYLVLLVGAKANLNILLDQAMPEIQTKMTDQCGKHKLSDFALKYWHYGNISSMTAKSFCRDCLKWAKEKGYRVNEQQALELYAMAQNGIPTLPFNPASQAAVSEAVRAVQHLETSRDTILAYMDELASTLPEYATIRAMNGIGITLAPSLIGEIGDIRRYHSSHALIAYAGIDAPPYQSGTFYGTKRSISKRGNKYLRKAGYEAMQTLARVKPMDDPVYLFMQKKELEGKPKKVAKIAAFNKFLRIYYARVTEVCREADRTIL